RYLGGPDALNRYAKAIGMKNSALWIANTTTPDDLTEALVSEALGRLGGTAAQAWLYPILTRTTAEQGIPAGLPGGTTVVHKTGCLAAAASGSERISPSPSSDTSQRPSGMRPTYGPNTSLKKRAVSAVDNSMASTDSGRRFTVIVASPAVRRLRTQLTSPKGLCTQRRPFTSTSATGVVRTWPPLRPRSVSKSLGPSVVPIRGRRAA